MPSTKELRKRIGTVKNTQQTTKAMKMVSAAKLRRAQDAIQNHRPFAKRTGDLIRLVAQLSDQPLRSALLEGGRDIDSQLGEGSKKRLLLVVVTSDRGLCGGFNANVVKATQRWLKESSEQYTSVQLAFVGRKAREFFKLRRNDLGPYFEEAGGKVTYAKAKGLADSLVKLYIDGEYDEIKVIYNEFKNAMSQKVQIESFLPIRPTASVESAVSAGSAAEEQPLAYLVKPSYTEVFAQLLSKHFSVQAFRILLESQAGEHGARMAAMENATKNAGEMIKKLTLQYNKQRQAVITKELLEIISGSEAQKN